jgi:hypothetical protein
MDRQTAAIGAAGVIGLDVVIAVVVAIGTSIVAPSFVVRGQEAGFYYGIPMIWHGIAPFVLGGVLLPLALGLWRKGQQDIARGIAIGVAVDVVGHVVLTYVVMAVAFASFFVSMMGAL